MIAPARVAAYDALRAVEDGRADLPAALAKARTRLADPRDRALASEIVTGTLRWRATLDHLIGQFGRRPVDRLDPEVLEVLRLSAYQLLHLERVPAAAVVRDAVDLARRSGKRSAAGFVNAVLRALDRSRGALPLPPQPAPDAPRDALLDYLSVTLSHPRWLAARWLDRHGFEAAAAWARFNNAPAPLTLRANRLKITVRSLQDRLAAAGVRTAATRYAPDGLVVVEGHPLGTPLAEAGLFVPQDEASQLVAAMAGVRPGERVLDACAAPGGKTTAFAAALGDRGLVVATDLRPRRMALLKQTVARCGADAVRLVRADLAERLPFRDATFDCVVVDAPCSGLGTIRRDPDIRWRRSPADLERLAATARVMLREAAHVVRPGGRLVYATCSSEPEENDEVVAAFLAETAGFTELPAREVVRGAPPGVAAVLDAAGRLRTLPHVHGLEAFFAVVLRRTERGTL